MSDNDAWKAPWPKYQPIIANQTHSIQFLLLSRPLFFGKKDFLERTLAWMPAHCYPARWHWTSRPQLLNVCVMAAGCHRLVVDYLITWLTLRNLFTWELIRFAKTLWMSSSARADASPELVNDELRIASLDCYSKSHLAKAISFPGVFIPQGFCSQMKLMMPL